MARRKRLTDADVLDALDAARRLINRLDAAQPEPVRWAAVDALLAADAAWSAKVIKRYAVHLEEA